MKLEIRNNYDSELAEAQGRVSKTKPLMGVLIGTCPKWGKSVKGVAVGKNIKEIIALLKIEQDKITEFADIR